jgi:two-component system, OmpR family, sensor kinase
MKRDRAPMMGDMSRRGLRNLLSSTRVQILGSYIFMLAIALFVGWLLLRALLLAQLSDEINAQLRQEVEELARLSGGRNPNTGQYFGNDIKAIFDTFLRRNVPYSGEAFYTLVNGKPYASSVAPVQLLSDAEIVASWAAITDPTLAEIETSGGRVRYLAVPVVAEDGGGGLFVVAHFLDETRRRTERTIQTGGLVFALVFAIVSVSAWFAAGRVLRPIGLLTEAAKEIEETNWSTRIPVKGNDEVAQLTKTFNDMLDRLEAAFYVQRQFIDDASHELRTPITIIRGHLEVMGDDPAEWAEVKCLVLDELGRMSRMVEDLLLLARAEQPEFLDVHAIDVHEFTNEVAAKISALSAEREWLVAEVAPVVMVADRHRLTQALMNLARNAVEYSEAGSAIMLGSCSGDGVVRFWIQDQGEGIAPEEQERIFQRFARGRLGRNRSEGAGLGLAIVKSIVEAHHGRILLDSTPGEGSRISLELPQSGMEEGG